jgi:hypothetical protein
MGGSIVVRAKLNAASGVSAQRRRALPRFDGAAVIAMRRHFWQRV